MYDVISIGAATVDIFVKSEQFVVKDNLLGLEYSSKNEISQSLICSGGGATNSSTSLSRLNLKTACLSLLGNDPLSLYVFNDLKDNSVSTDLLVHDDKELTDYSVILVAQDGGRSILTNRGSTRLQSPNVNWEKLSLTNWLYITSLEGNIDLLEQIIGFAIEHGIKVSLNPGNRELSQLPRLLPLLPHVDFLLLNKTESEHFNESQLRIPAITAVTYGREGAYVFVDDKKFFSPIINTSPVDETGAGDAFGSAFVGGLVHHLSPQEALFWAIKNSASVVSYLGAKHGLLNLLEIKQ
jgi:sugar/nucleoside kinase (ribokinase family)